MLPQNVVQSGGTDIAAACHQVVEPLLPGGMGGRFAGGKHGIELHCQFLRIYHCIFGVAGMGGKALEQDLSIGSVEVFPFHKVRCAAINGVGIIGAEEVHIKVGRSAPDLLIRCKSDGKGTVRDFFFQDLLNGSDNDGNTGFVIGPQKSGSIGGDEGMPLEILSRRNHKTAFTEFDRLTGPVFNDLRLDVRPGCGIGGIQMGDESQAGNIFASRSGRKFGVHITLIGQCYVINPQSKEFIPDKLCELELFFCGGIGLCGSVRLSVKRHIFKETCCDFFHSKAPFVFYCMFP